MQAHKSAYSFAGMSTLADRLKQARKHGKLTQTALAEQARVEQPLISQIETGKNLQSAHLVKFAAICGVSPVWLATGEGAMVASETSSLAATERDFQQAGGHSSEHANVLPVATLPRKRTKYPVISWVRAGDWAESPDNFQPGDADDWLESEEKAGPHGYWLVVDGDSMTPLFPQGSRILVQPEGFDLISGKYYVAICYEPGRKRDTTVKQYVRDAGFEYLKPLNPTYRTLEVSEAVRIVGRVIDYKLPPGVL